MKERFKLKYVALNNIVSSASMFVICVVQGPPPHFRRWMQKFMKRWHNRNAPGWKEGACNEGDSSEEKKGEEGMEQGPEESSGESSGEDFVKSLGEHVAKMLDPFGMYSNLRLLKLIPSHLKLFNAYTDTSERVVMSHHIDKPVMLSDQYFV